MKRITKAITAIGFLTFAWASANFVLRPKEDAQVPAQVIPAQVVAPLRHNIKAEQFWNSRLVEVVRQGDSVRLVGDEHMHVLDSRWTKSIKVLRVGEGWFVPDQHGGTRYTLKRIQADGVILEYSSRIYSASEVRTSRTWIKLKWRSARRRKP